MLVIAIAHQPPARMYTPTNFIPYHHPGQVGCCKPDGSARIDCWIEWGYACHDDPQKRILNKPA